MTKGFTVTNVQEVKNPNCILVANYHGENDVCNFMQNYRTIKKTIAEEKKNGTWHGNDVGVWRIKTIK
jgi:hypothetical protein